MQLLPNADQARISIEKLRDYSLNSEHPVGKHKARVFRTALDMNEKDAERLRSMILSSILTNESKIRGSNRHGTRYSVDFEILGKSGPVSIRTAWIIDLGEEIPRLTSCYVVK